MRLGPLNARARTRCGRPWTGGFYGWALSAGLSDRLFRLTVETHTAPVILSDSPDEPGHGMVHRFNKGVERVTNPLRFFFTKTDRILKRSEFLRLQQSGTKIHHDHFIVSYGPGRCDRSRLGITVTKRVGNAVTRNRIKRMAREFFRLNRHTITGRLDIVIIAKQEAAGLRSDQVATALQDLFDRIHKKNFC